MEVITTTDSQKSAKTLTMVIYALYAPSFLLGITTIYALYAASFLLGIPAIVAIIINYVKKDDVAGTFLESHFRWQIRTFWFGLLWGVLGAIALFWWGAHVLEALRYFSIMVIIGFFVLVANFIWIIYRIVKGLLRLNDNRPMYEG